MQGSSIILSPELFLVYILRQSGCSGQLTAGTVQRSGPCRLNVFDEHGKPFDYVSGDALRTWCVIDPAGKPVEGWSEIMAGDLPALVSHIEQLRSAETQTATSERIRSADFRP
jgi:hypothetical protein